MATLTGTRSFAPRNAGIDELVYASGYYTLAAALSTSNTYEIDLFAGLEGFDVIPVAAEVYGVEADTNATPTGTFKVGDFSDDDGILTTKGMAVGLQNSLAGQLFYKGDGALIKAGTRLTGTKIIITPVANPATGATSGDIFVGVWAKVVAKV
jgi:hypothetical protein